MKPWNMCRAALDEQNVLLLIQKDLPAIRGDRARLVEVLQNLIDNAAKYSNPDSQPIIEIGTTEGPGQQHCHTSFAIMALVSIRNSMNASLDYSIN